MWIWWLIIGISALIVLLLYSRLMITLQIIMQTDCQYFVLTVYFYGIRLIKKQVDLTNQEDGELSVDEGITYLRSASKDIFQKLKRFNEIVTIVFKRLVFHKFSWSTQVGTGKASSAGITAGSIWSAKGMIIGLISMKSKFKQEPIISVVPFFNQMRFQSKFDCMVSIRIGQAMYALLKVLRKLPFRSKQAIQNH